MVRKYKWTLTVRSYESDALGQAPASVVLRYLEQAAVMAAADAGYGREFYEEHGSAWVIRRMTLALQNAARSQDELEVATWASHFTRIRGMREYSVQNLTTGLPVAGGIAEWIYVDRKTLAALGISSTIAAEFDAPGEPLGSYDAPVVAPLPEPREFRVERRAEWHECDSMGHVNNTVYVDWLGDALRQALEEMGWGAGRLSSLGVQLRGEHYRIDYKRAALPGDSLSVETRIEGSQDRLCAVGQSIASADGTELLAASSVHGWRTLEGERAAAPEGWAL